MEIREMSHPDELRQVIPVAASAWGSETAEEMLADALRALEFHGGLVLGAFEEGRLIGFQFSFIGMRKGQLYLYSHMTGVVGESKGRGVGYELKMAQKEWAKAHGFGLVAWTFDPLMSLNAHFNISKLGAIARSYRPNFYGQMGDELNRGMETDRIFAEWWIRYPSAHTSIDPLGICINPTRLTGGFRRMGDTMWKELEVISIEIPRDIQAIKSVDPALATDWRLKSRELLTQCFSAGYCITDVSLMDDRTFYILSRDYPQKGEVCPFD